MKPLFLVVIIGILFILVILYYFGVQPTKTETFFRNTSVELLANYSRQPLSIGYYAIGTIKFLCVAGKVQYCYLPNRNNYTYNNFTVDVNNNFSELVYQYNITLKKVPLVVNPPQKYIFTVLNYSYGNFNIGIIPLVNISNISSFVQDYGVSNSKVNFNFKNQLQAGNSYIATIQVSKNFLENYPEVCIDQDCQMLGCISTVASSTSSDLTPLNMTIQETVTPEKTYGVYCSLPADVDWLSALSWINQNVGLNAPKVLAWWDYGDWINWFGNSSSVIRGENQTPQKDYQVAADLVLTQEDNFTPTTLVNFMDQNKAQYVLFDDQLVQKWGALDFLACTYINQTSAQYAEQAGTLDGRAYALGTSNCEQRHDPAYIFVGTNPNSYNHCVIGGNVTANYITGQVVIGDAVNGTYYCVPISVLTNRTEGYLLNDNGTKSNIIINPSITSGTVEVQGQQYLIFLLLYMPNGPNDTITNAPTQFYSSVYYKGFFLGTLPGFRQVYPKVNGTNFVNSTQKIRIYKLVNYSG